MKKPDSSFAPLGPSLSSVEAASMASLNSRQTSVSAPDLLHSARWWRRMLAAKPWSVGFAHHDFSSWERSSPNGDAIRCPTETPRILCLDGSGAGVRLGISCLERDSPSRIRISGRLFEPCDLEVPTTMRIFLSARRLEIPPDAGNFNITTLFARVAPPALSSWPLHDRCGPLRRARPRQASRVSNPVAPLVLTVHVCAQQQSTNHRLTGCI